MMRCVTFFLFRYFFIVIVEAQQRRFPHYIARAFQLVVLVIVFVSKCGQLGWEGRTGVLLGSTSFARMCIFWRAVALLLGIFCSAPGLSSNLVLVYVLVKEVLLMIWL